MENSFWKKNLLQTNLNLLVIPLFSVLILVVLFVLLTKIGLSSIWTQKEKVDLAGKEEKILTEKISLLQSLGSQISAQANSFSYALPERNSTLSVFSQLKNLGVSKGVFLENIKSGVEVKDTDLYRIDISFDALGELNSVTGFLASIKDVAPVMVVERARLSQAESTIRSSITVRAFWSPFPSNLPLVTQPQKSFTKDELDLIKQVSKLMVPSLVKLPPAIGPSDRKIPF